MSKKTIDEKLMKQGCDFIKNEGNFHKWLLTRPIEELRKIEDEEKNSKLTEYLYVILYAFGKEKDRDVFTEEEIQMLGKGIVVECALASLVKLGLAKVEIPFRYFDPERDMEIQLTNIDNKFGLRP